MYRSLFVGLSFLVLLSHNSVEADMVVLSFDTDTQGFADQNGTIAWTSDFGGQLRVTGSGGADFFEADARAAILNYASGTSQAPAIANELAAVFSNGGTISYDIRIEEDEIQWASAARPSLLESQLTFQGAGSDTEVALLSVPGAGQTSFGSFSATFAIVPPGAGNQFNGTDGTINYDGSDPGSFSVGWKDEGNFITSGSFYIDNFTINAVPEPNSFLLTFVIMIGVLSRRRRA